MKRPRRFLVALASIAAVLAAGCVGPTAAAPAKSGAPAPLPAASPSPEPSCLNMRVSADTVRLTARNMAGIAERVFAATIQSVGTGHWNSADGARPSDPSGLGAAIYTDVTFGQASFLRGPAAAQVTLRLAGGSVGCSKEEFTSSPVLSTGTRHLVWVGSAYDQAQTGNSTPWIMGTWPIGAGDQVETPADGTLALSDIASIVRANPLGSHGQCEGGKCP